MNNMVMDGGVNGEQHVNGGGGQQHWWGLHDEEAPEISPETEWVKMNEIKLPQPNEKIALYQIQFADLQPN